jgi:hypothetical protein
MSEFKLVSEPFLDSDQAAAIPRPFNVWPAAPNDGHGGAMHGTSHQRNPGFAVG